MKNHVQFGRSASLAAMAILLLGCVAPIAAYGGVGPHGFNDWTCRPDAGHPQPVVLIHGTFENAEEDWRVLRPRLQKAGYCTYALDYGDMGYSPVMALAPPAESAEEVGAFVDRVLSVTGTTKVLLVGFSQGSVVARYWMRFLGGTAKVAGLVSLAPSTHGYRSPAPVLLKLLAPPCPACEEQIVGSPFLTKLNADREVEDGVLYTVISTKVDEVVTPWRSQYLAGPSSQVTNVAVQDLCPGDLNGHIMFPVDPIAGDLVLSALADGGRLGPAVRPDCASLAHQGVLSTTLRVFNALIKPIIRSKLPRQKGRDRSEVSGVEEAPAEAHETLSRFGGGAADSRAAAR